MRESVKETQWYTLQWKGNFEGMRHHLNLQNWDMILVGDVETKWLGFKTVLLDLSKDSALLLGRRVP